MAKIISFEKGSGNIKGRISEVECVYNTGIVNGERYLSFSTYGSKNREFTGSASQVLHFNKENAEEMIQILKQEFNL
ncbi:methionyl-tRNA formyltransferase [Acetobacterium wieringae]|uniref:Methionyl-tRNA formyltransferase n=1 Tax=Acetobacterium wieringae TaxID=52694 RepID=A0ABY6H9K9_9FIRM|nr:methionyl-tRNA formyltransferase [Acetobacterium wieringae]UYO61169.1 methionyl-tRNA formyltransferase [Acetobacterium wieringae]VUZ24429.1 Uncharacterised protein [Acetobacterium wieringae]